MGKGTFRFLTLYAIQTLLPPKPVVKHLKFKLRYLTVTFRLSFIFQNVEYVVKLFMSVRQKRNVKRDLIIIKVHAGPIEKRKVSQKRFHEHDVQHSHNRIVDWQFRLI